MSSAQTCACLNLIFSASVLEKKQLCQQLAYFLKFKMNCHFARTFGNRQVATETLCTTTVCTTQCVSHSESRHVLLNNVH